jgi:hypothetical protein
VLPWPHLVQRERRAESHTDVRAALAVVGSVLVHAALLVIFASENDDEPIVVIPETQPPQATPSPEPTEVELVFDSDAPTTTGGDVVVAGAAHISRGGRGSAVRGSESSDGGNGAGDGKPAHSDLMKMRKPGTDLQGISGSFLGKFLENSKPLAPPPDIPGERVGNEIADLRAKLRRAERYSPDELAAMRAQLVALNEELKNEELEPSGGGTYKTEKETFRAHVNPDGSVKLVDKPQNMDSQDRMMLEHGIDPYAAAKMAYLDRTRDQRVAIGKRFREQELKKSVIYMQQNIARLWAMTTDVQKRKQGLFELWDECIEKGSPEEIAGGEAARAFVMSYIRAKVRYTQAELDKLNTTRLSTQVFAP